MTTIPTEKAPSKSTASNSAFPAARKSLDLILKNPVVIVPVLLAEVVLTLLAWMLNPWFVELFDWYWLADLSYISSQVLVVSAIFQVVVVAVTLLSVFTTLEMARIAVVEGKASFSKGLKSVFRRILPLLVVAFVGQAFLLTGILIPIGLALWIVAIEDNAGVGEALPKAARFFRAKFVDVLILTVILFGVRFALSLIPVPHIFELSVASDVIMLIALLVLYISCKPQTTNARA